MIAPYAPWNENLEKYQNYDNDSERFSVKTLGDV